MAFTRTGTPNHDTIAGVSPADHHTQTVAGDLNLADLATRAHANLSDAPADAHHANQHVINSAVVHTGSITDAQHFQRTVANAHRHGDMASLGGPFTDHNITAADIALIRLYGH